MKIKLVLSAVGVCALTVGAAKTFEVYRFVQSASAVVATVVAVEERTGPPKPRQNTPLHVRYRDRDGQDVLATTHLPLLQVVKEGETVPLLVSSTNPQDVRLPLMSELWATALTYLVVGCFAVVVGVVFSTKQLPSRGSAE
jgi:hypothetical protein